MTNAKIVSSSQKARRLFLPIFVWMIVLALAQIAIEHTNLIEDLKGIFDALGPG